MSDVFLDREVVIYDDRLAGEPLKYLTIKDCKAWEEGGYWFFRCRDDQGEIIIPAAKVLQIRAGTQMSK